MNNKKYLSSLITNAYLHAGGNLFSTIYQNCITFFDNEKVILTKIAFEELLQIMDEDDIQFLNNYEVIGKYHYDEKGYIICIFPEIYLTFTGKMISKNDDYLIFSIHDSRLLKNWGEVFVCTK